MDDARNLQYGIGFDTADAETSVENLGEKVETLEENIGAVEVGAQQMGASAVSACQMGQGAAERFTGAVGDASGGLDDMASSASKAGNAAQKAAGHWNMTAEGLEWVEEAAQAAEAAAESFRDEMDDSGGAAGRFRAQIKKTAESAQDMGPAFKGAMADGLDAGQSIAKSFRTGVTGAMDFTKKRAEIFANNMVRNAKNISKAFQHPIKIIRSGLVSALRRAKKSEDETADGADDAGTVLLVEHPPVYTLGKSGHAENLLVNQEALEAMGAQFFHIDRGGDITFHGPGQLVCYPILDLERIGIGLREYIEALEEAVIRTVAEYGIAAGRIAGASGVWIDPGKARPRKICAIGVRSSRYVTMHGFALNVTTDLEWFSRINPCGFTDRGVTSIAAETGSQPSMQEVKQLVIRELATALQCEITSGS